MMIGPCPSPDEHCPYYQLRTRGPLRDSQEHGCYSDIDHKVPQRLARLASATELEVAYIYSEANEQRLCRWEHDLKVDEELPDIFTMLAALTEIEVEYAETA